MSYVNPQKEFYENCLNEAYPHHYKIVTCRNELEGLKDLPETKKFIQSPEKLKFTKEETLIKNEKKATISRFCSFLGSDEGSHIIPQHGYNFFEDLELDSTYLRFRTGDNIIRTSSNLHNFMELQGKSKENPPLLTIVPLRWIEMYFRCEFNGHGAEGFYNYLKSIGIMTETNSQFYDNMLIITHPDPYNLYQDSISVIHSEILNGIANGRVNNLDNGHLYWLVHSAWTFYYWGFYKE